MNTTGKVSSAERLRIKALRAIVNVLFGLTTKRTIVGLEHIPKEGACILVFNHVSNFDPPLIFGFLPRYDLTALVAAEYKANSFYKKAIEWSGGTWIRRGESDRHALKEALNALENGWILGISPEGGRSKNGRMRDGKPGPSFLAIHSNAPLLPVGLTGTGEIAQGLKRFRRVPLSIAIGPVFELPPALEEHHKQHLQQCTNEIMCQIAALIPPEYHAHFKDQPRLKELLLSRSKE